MERIDQIPAVHSGAAASAMEKRGDLNREIEVTNQKLRQEAEQIRRSVYSILRQEQREQQSRRAQDMER